MQGMYRDTSSMMGNDGYDILDFHAPDRETTPDRSRLQPISQTLLAFPCVTLLC